MSRTKKKEYTGIKKISKQCRCHGGCQYCEGNRMARNKRRLEEWMDKIKQFFNRK